MTVTFAPEYRETDLVLYEIHCPVVGTITTDLTYGDAKLTASAHGLWCPDIMCADYGAEIRTITEVPEVNVSNGNAFHLLALLGLNAAAGTGDRPGPFECGDLSGSCTAEDFLGRILLAQRLNCSDEGVPMHLIGGGEGGARVYDCGRRAGYSDETLLRLARVGEWARAAGRDVQWC